jgi:hypothetical protein
MSIPAVFVDVAFDNDPLEASPTWQPLTDVKQIRIERGRQGSIGRIEAARCSVILRNGDRLYDPTNTTSPQYGDGSRLEFGKRIRVRMAALPAPPAGYADVVLFTGNTTGTHQRAGSEPIQDLRLEATDAFGYFGATRFSASLGEAAADVRLGHILDAVGWPSGAAWRDFQAGGTNMPTLAAKSYADASALSAIQEVVDSERCAC